MTEDQKRIVLLTLNAWRAIGKEERSRIRHENAKEKYPMGEIQKPIPGDFLIKRGKND